jgi:Lrp/AsnC family transcriptional regulator for asnA, asnC and gidA
MRRKTDLKLDKKDRDLLYQLDVDGRLTYSQLARKTKMSKQLVKYRVERLENEGYIKGYFTMIDTSKLGYTTFRVYLKFRNLTSEKKKAIINYLKKEDKIWAVVMISGKWDVALGISVKDIYAFYEVWDSLLERYLKYIGDYQTSIYSPIYHYSKSYLVGENDDSNIRILGGKDRVDYDSKDVGILIEMSKNARVSLLDLSDKLKITPESIGYRIKQLVKRGIIQGYRAMIDVNKMGYEFYKMEIRLADYSKIKEILGYCHKHQNIYQVDRTIGGETLDIEFHVRSLNEMLKIMEEFESRFPKIIEKFDYITVLREEKTTYMPGS